MTYPITKLGEVAEFVRGITFKPDDVVPLDAADAVVCMRTKNVQALLDCDDLLAVPSQFVRRKDQYLEEGDILVSSANSWNLVGKCCWVPDLPWRTAFGGFISVLRGDSARVDRRYLYWWFASERIQTLLRSFGQKTTNISNLNIERCLQLDLPLPPLAEQRRIAAILDKADVLRAKRREALAQLEHLTQSIFVEMFGDPITGAKGCTPKKLADCVSKLEYGPRFYNEAYSSDGIRIVRITDLDQSGSLDFDAMPRMAVDEQTKKQFVLQPDDIVFARTGATVGKVALIRASDPPSIAGAYFIRLRFDESVIPLYAFSVLRAKSVQALIAKQSRQAAQQNFSGPGLRALPMPVPPMAKQLSFARQVEKVWTKKQKFETSLAEMGMLISSLQHRAFTGEL